MKFYGNTRIDYQVCKLTSLVEIFLVLFIVGLQAPFLSVFVQPASSFYK